MKAEPTKGKVLVTGANGFLGSHITKLLLEGGYAVRGTVRDKNNKEKLSALNSLRPPKNLEIYEANLSDSSAIEKAIEGCDYVMHVAAPVMMAGEESLIVNPAVEGTRYVMEAAIKYKIKKVVFTSSMTAVINTDLVNSKAFDEGDWPNMDKPQSPYIKAKALSEKMAWDFYNKAPKETRPQFTVINPGFILGPTMGKTSFFSGHIVRELLSGKKMEIPKIYYGIVDVRDAALAHLRALEKPETDGQRYVCFSGEYFWLEDLARVIKEEFEKYGYEVEGKVMEECPDKDPNSFLASRWNKSYRLNNKKIKKDLGLEFMKAKDSAIAMGFSMAYQKVIPDYIKK